MNALVGGPAGRTIAVDEEPGVRTPIVLRDRASPRWERPRRSGRTLGSPKSSGGLWRRARWTRCWARLKGGRFQPPCAVASASMVGEPESATHETQDEAFGRDDSVQQCLAIMREVSAEQRARARHLDTKTGALAGFCATVLTLNVALGQPLLKMKLAPDAHSAIRILFLIASLLLALAALIAVAGVLRPMGHDDLTEEQIDQYSDRPKVITPPEELRMTWLRTVTDMTISDRKAGGAKSIRSNAAVIALVLGLLAVAGEALTLFFAS
jgi:hypothetical protein